MYIVTKETAEAYLKSKAKPPVVVPEPEQPVTPRKPGQPVTPTGKTGPTGGTGTVSPPIVPSDTVAKLAWTGTVPAQKWMNFYTEGAVEVRQRQGPDVDRHGGSGTEGGISRQKVEETKIALRELGLDDDVANS